MGDDTRGIVVKSSRSEFEAVSDIQSAADSPFQDNFSHDPSPSDLGPLSLPSAEPQTEVQGSPRPRPPPQKRVYIGAPPPSLYTVSPAKDTEVNYLEGRPGTRVYIGDRAAFDWFAIASVPESDSRSSTLSPPPSSDVELNGGDSPGKRPLSQQDLAFAMAQALHAANTPDET